MAIVETLEIRFTAKLGNLAAQIAAITSALGGLSGAGDAAMAAVSGASFAAKNALDGVSAASREAEKKQGSLASKLKKTGRALKNVSSQAKKAAEGIGLHKMDEVNLVGDDKSGSSSSGGRKSGSGSSYGGAAADLKMLEKLRDMLSSMDGFFKRFFGNFGKNLKSLGGWIDKLTGGLAGDMIRSLGNLGKDAAQSLSGALKQKLGLSTPEIAAKGRNMLLALGESIRSGAASSAAPAQAGALLTTKLKGGILSGQASVKNAAATVTNAVKFGSESAKSEARSAGANLSGGLAEGILSKLKKVRDAAARLARAALDKLKNLLKIASPSKVAFKMGGFFSEGFAGGIRSSVQLAENSASVLAGGAAMQLSPASASFAGASDLRGMVASALNEALGGTNIVIPLNVDGIRLGEASIRGINRVTRASGRLMLEI